jgi:enoyl-[acyl-carrier protein] reductase I
MGTINELAQITSSKVIVADATSMVDIDKLVAESMEIFGGRFDFILHSIGMSPNVRKGIPYENTSYENMLKTFDISALSFHRILQTTYKYDAINEWGSVVALSYVAAQRTLTGYNDMGDAKALLESIARTFGYIYGRDRKVRINTVSQSPTLTTAGSGIHGFDSLVDFSERMSPLGNATAEECADYCVVLFSDLTRKVTMQNLYHDGGFSSMGMSLKAIEQYKKSFEECDCDDK